MSQYPGQRAFEGTLVSCGTNARNIELLFHSLTWEKKLSPPYRANLAYRYFQDPSLFFLVLNKFWAVDGQAPTNIFPDFIRFIIKGVKTIKGVETNGETDIPYLYSAIRALEANTTNITVDDIQPISVDTQIPYEKTLVVARKRFLDDLKKYIKHVASWPLNEDLALFTQWRRLLRRLKIVENSEEEQNFIEVYKMLESKLATLTSFSMGGKGLPPMPLYKGTIDPPASIDLSPAVITEEEYERVLKGAEELYKEREASQRQNRLALEWKKDEYEQDKKRLEQDGATAARLERLEKEHAESLRVLYSPDAQQRDIMDVGEAYEAYQNARSNVPWTAWPETVWSTEEPGVIDRWYAWAAQFWLRDGHTKWFHQVAKLSRTETTASLLRNTQIVVLDDSSTGVSKFGRYGLNALNMPHLVYVYTLRNESPWWRPPELGWDELTTDANIAVEKITDEKQRMVVIHDRLNALKISLDEGLMLDNGNVVIYSTSPEIIGYCLVNDVNVIVFNNWLTEQPIEIKALKEQVLRQRGLLGRVVTPLLPESTVILTFVVLLAVSCSSGIPMYVGFGWSTVFSTWVNLVREYQKMVKPNRNDPYTTCAWLARRGIDNRIIINRSLFIPLVSRILHGKFANDKPSTKLTSAYNIWSTKYKDLINENRVGTGRVEPIPVLNMWTPFTTELYESSDNKSDEFKQSALSAEAQRFKDERDRRFESRLKEWEEARDLFNNEQLEARVTQRDEYQSTIAEVTVSKNTQDIKDYDEAISVAIQNKQKNELTIQAVEENIIDKEKQKEEWETKVEEAKKKLENLTVKRNEYLSSAYFSNVPSVSQNEVDVQKNMVDLVKQSLDIADLAILKEEAQLLSVKNKSDSLAQAVIRLQAQPRPEPLLVSTLMSRWDVANPPNYTEYTVPKPVQMPYDGRVDMGDEEMNFLNVIAGVELNTREYEADSSDEELAEKVGTVNTTLDSGEVEWAKCSEWMYAQRQMFQDKYYAPFDFDDLVQRFRIRLRDWTGATIITINT